MVKFSAGDKAVYPGHGVGTIKSVEIKEILGKKHSFYTLELLDTGMKIMVPMDNVKLSV